MTEVMSHIEAEIEEVNPDDQLAKRITEDIIKLFGAIVTPEHDPRALHSELFERVYEGLAIAYNAGQTDAFEDVEDLRR